MPSAKKKKRQISKRLKGTHRPTIFRMKLIQLIMMFSHKWNTAWLETGIFCLILGTVTQFSVFVGTIWCGLFIPNYAFLLGFSLSGPSECQRDKKKKRWWAASQHEQGLYPLFILATGWQIRVCLICKRISGRKKKKNLGALSCTGYLSTGMMFYIIRGHQRSMKTKEFIHSTFNTNWENLICSGHKEEYKLQHNIYPKGEISGKYFHTYVKYLNLRYSCYEKKNEEYWASGKCNLKQDGLGRSLRDI